MRSVVVSSMMYDGKATIGNMESEQTVQPDTHSRAIKISLPGEIFMCHEKGRSFILPTCKMTGGNVIRHEGQWIHQFNPTCPQPTVVSNMNGRPESIVSSHAGYSGLVCLLLLSDSIFYYMGRNFPPPQASLSKRPPSPCFMKGPHLAPRESHV